MIANAMTYCTAEEVSDPKIEESKTRSRARARP
jgi:hypothetical protein